MFIKYIVCIQLLFDIFLFIYVSIDSLNPNRKKNNIFDNLFEDEGSNSDSCSNLTVDEKSSSNIKSSKGIIIFKLINHLIFLKKIIYSSCIYKMENNMCNNCTYVDSFIKQILKKYQDGVIILQYYTSNGTLNQKMRNRLCGVLIKDALHSSEYGNKITRSQFSKIAKGTHFFYISEMKKYVLIKYIMYACNMF